MAGQDRLSPVTETGLLNREAVAPEGKCAMLQAALRELLPEPGDYAIGVDGLTLYRREERNVPQGEGLAAPHATIVFQGAESVTINGREFLCGPCQFRMTSQEAFGCGHIADASLERPFLAASLALDRKLLTALRTGASVRSGSRGAMLKTVAVEAADADILDAFYRLVMLHNKPARISALAPLIIYEIHYLLSARANALFWE